MNSGPDGRIIATATGLLFVTAADRKVHVYDSATGTQLWELPLGAGTSGAPWPLEADLVDAVDPARWLVRYGVAPM